MGAVRECTDGHPVEGREGGRSLRGATLRGLRLPLRADPEALALDVLPKLLNHDFGKRPPLDRLLVSIEDHCRRKKTRGCADDGAEQHLRIHGPLPFFRARQIFKDAGPMPRTISEKNWHGLSPPPGGWILLLAITPPAALTFSRHSVAICCCARK